MQEVDDETLDDLLSRWHHWASRYVHVRGFKGRALVVGEFRISRQYDDVNGALDDEIENAMMAALDFQIDQLSAVHKLAISSLARAIYIGCDVLINPRLPQSQSERRALIHEARNALKARVLAEGLVSC